MLQKTVSSVLVVYVCLSPAVCGIVFRLSKIIKDGKNSPPGTDK